MTIKNLFHTNFKLQERSFENHQELIHFSKNISSQISSFLEEWFDSKEFVEVQTSGSTGIPKTVRLQKRHMVQSAVVTGAYFNLPKSSKALLCMSPEFIAGKMMLIRALTLGWHLDVVEPSSSPLKNCNKKYDFTAMVPLQLHHSLNEIDKVKKIIIGGGSVSKDLVNKIKYHETEIFATYGMTETITHIAVKKLNHFSPDESRKTAYFELLPDISISLDNSGCLVINAPRIADHKIVTKDLAEIISNKSFKWLGRYDSVINSGGIKLIPEQIEEKLGKVITNRFFITGRPDAVLGEKLILVVENETNNFSKENLLRKIRSLKNISKFEIPKEIFVLRHFIETPTNKVNRAKTVQLIVS